jgi:hypothetical protein
VIKFIGWIVYYGLDAYGYTEKASSILKRLQ